MLHSLLMTIMLQLCKGVCGQAAGLHVGSQRRDSATNHDVFTTIRRRTATVGERHRVSRQSVSTLPTRVRLCFTCQLLYLFNSCTQLQPCTCSVPSSSVNVRISLNLIGKYSYSLLIFITISRITWLFADFKPSGFLFLVLTVTLLSYTLC